MPAPLFTANSSPPRSWKRRFALTQLCCGVALALGSCGGEDEGRPSTRVPTVPDVNQCERAQGFTFQTIVDFEDQQDPSKQRDDCRAPAPCAADPFYFNYDARHTVSAPGQLPEDTSSCASLEPAEINISQSSLANGIVLIPDNGRCQDTAVASTRALHVTGTNIATCVGITGRPGWGAGLDLTFTSAFDVSDWDGISFWVRRGSAATKPSLIFSVVDQPNDSKPTATEDHCNCWPLGDPRTPRCFKDTSLPCALGGPCSLENPTENALLPDGLKCDAFGTAITLSDEWTFVTAYFSALRQKGFGKASVLDQVATGPVCVEIPDGSAGPDGAGGAGTSAGGSGGSVAAGAGTTTVCEGGLTRLQFLFTSGDLDFWLDDIALFKAPE